MRSIHYGEASRGGQKRGVGHLERRRGTREVGQDSQKGRALGARRSALACSFLSLERGERVGAPVSHCTWSERGVRGVQNPTALPSLSVCFHVLGEGLPRTDSRLG